MQHTISTITALIYTHMQTWVDAEDSLELW